jgi:uncharacterized hydrophobic protein (TIGR00271 family)
MVHMRIVAPPHSAEKALEVLLKSPSAVNVVHLQGAARKPDGDMLLADVAREDASLIVDDLRELDIPAEGSIAIELVDTQISAAADRAERQARGAPSDAVVWEEVESRISEDTHLSVSFLAFMVLAMLIAAVGIFLDQPILIVGAMVLGPEYGPLAGFCVAVVELRGRLARRSLMALVVGFPLGIAFVMGVTLLFRALDLVPAGFDTDHHPLTAFLADPDFLSFFVAFLAGVAGVLSLTSAKSGALIGVLVSVTTIPAAANIGVAAVFGDWSQAGGAVLQLTVNVAAIVLAGISTLYVQRRLYVVRRRRHLSDPASEGAGLPRGGNRRPVAIHGRRP